METTVPKSPIVDLWYFCTLIEHAYNGSRCFRNSKNFRADVGSHTNQTCKHIGHVRFFFLCGNWGVKPQIIVFLPFFHWKEIPHPMYPIFVSILKSMLYKEVEDPLGKLTMTPFFGSKVLYIDDKGEKTLGCSYGDSHSRSNLSASQSVIFESRYTENRIYHQLCNINFFPISLYLLKSVKTFFI